MLEERFLIPKRECVRSYESGLVVPVAIRIHSDQNPWQIACRMLDKARSFFLDSVRYQSKTAHFSYLGWNPFLIFRSGASRNPIRKLKKLLARYPGRRWAELPFFTGGAVGYFSYELGRVFEQIPEYAINDLTMDRSQLLFVRNVLVYDHRAKDYYLISNMVPEKDGSFKSAWEKASKLIKKNILKLGISNGHTAPVMTSPAKRGEAISGTGSLRSYVPHSNRMSRIQICNFRADISKQKFKRMVLKAKQYIEAGHIYQANLSQRFTFDFSGDPKKLYDSLRRINPSPFSSYLSFPGLTIVSSSPERLIKKVGDYLETRPIAGTRPRGKTVTEEKRFTRALVTNSKERAEHIMLVDLERNDLGRVSVPKSVRVNELMTVERYSHVVHIVSNVVGRIRKDCDGLDLLKAVFPGGTITGCPKVRSMEIIEELEPFRRHLYTGSIGYLDFNGDLDLNIVIRSLILVNGKGYLQVGAGIVYDSDPEAEYWETLHKGKALVEALCEHV
jgi:anthranilate/para-aminobenzoate synthase component I